MMQQTKELLYDHLRTGSAMPDEKFSIARFRSPSKKESKALRETNMTQIIKMKQ